MCVTLEAVSPWERKQTGSYTTGPMECCADDELPSHITVCRFRTPPRGERGAGDPATSVMGDGGLFLYDPAEELELCRDTGCDTLGVVLIWGSERPEESKR